MNNCKLPVDNIVFSNVTVRANRLIWRGESRTFGQEQAYFPVNWRATSRDRALISNSARTTCCQVPNSNFDPSNGMTNDGQKRLARTWLEPLLSPQVASWWYGLSDGAICSASSCMSFMRPGSYSKAGHHLSCL